VNRLRGNSEAYSALAAYLRGGRLPHAILLEGAGGSGKTTFAREIAQGALCSAPPEERPCGVCRDCVKAEKGIHPDILEYAGSGGSLSFHVDLVRELRREAYVRPNEGQCKVMILEDVQNMTIQAGNALLKIIEEPPSGVVFILTCENKSSLLVTILSRVTVIPLALPTPRQCAEALRERMPGLEEERYQSAAGDSQGSVGAALKLLEAGDGGRGQAREILEALCLGSELDALAQLGRLEKDKDALLALLNRMAGEVRGLLSHTLPSDPGSLRLRKRISPLRLMRILAIIEETAGAVPQNVSRLVLITNLCARTKLVLSA